MEQGFSQHDSAIWRTVRINTAMDRNELHTLEHLGTPFAPSIAPGSEHMLVNGTYVLAVYRALGDGTYQHNNSFFFATGTLGLALTAGMAAGQAAGNSSRRNQAAMNAVPRWVVDDQGMVFVSDRGFYFQSQLGHREWNFDFIGEMELCGPALVRMVGQSTTGQVHFMIQSDWSELIFSLWARARHPHHAQFKGATWIPPGWRERAEAAGYGFTDEQLGRWSMRALSGAPPAPATPPRQLQVTATEPRSATEPESRYEPESEPPHESEPRPESESESRPGLSLNKPGLSLDKDDASDSPWNRF